MTQLVAFGDLHLQKGEALHPARLAEQEAVLDRILTDARNMGAAAVLMAGDLFDRRRPSPEAMLTAERPLVKHRERGCPVIAIPGNHDLIDLDTGCGMDVLAEAGLIELHREPGVVRVPGAWVACLPWAPVSRLRSQLGPDVPADEVNQACGELLIRIARDLRASVDGPCVLMAHWSVDAAVLPSGLSVADLREVVLPLSDLTGLDYDAVVLSHIHRGQLLTDSPPVLYTGPPLALDFGDNSNGYGYWIVGPGAHPEFVPIESPRFLTFDQEIAADVSDAYVRLRVSVPSGEQVDARWLERDIIETGGARYARVEVTVERAARGRVEALDDTVTEAAAFGMWLDAVEATEDERPWLLTLDQHYREQVAA